MTCKESVNVKQSCQDECRNDIRSDFVALAGTCHTERLLYGNRSKELSTIASCMRTTIVKKRKEKFMLFSNHNGGLLRRQPGATTIVNCSLVSVNKHAGWYCVLLKVCICVCSQSQNTGHMSLGVSPPPSGLQSPCSPTDAPAPPAPTPSLRSEQVASHFATRNRDSDTQHC